MAQETPGQPSSSFQFYLPTVCAALGALVIAAGVLLAIEDLTDGGNYAVGFASWELWEIAFGFLVLLCAAQLGNASWGESLRRAAPAIGIAVVGASVALAVWDITDDVGETLWRPLNDLFYYIPITLGVAIYLSGTVRGDRVLGSPWEYGRIIGVIALIAGLAIAIDDVSDASSDEILVFLSSFGETGALALFLLAVSLEPASAMTRSQGGQMNVGNMLNDSRLPDWIAIGGVAVVVAGVILGLDLLSENDGIFLAFSYWGYYLGLGSIVILASGGRILGQRLGDQPAMRYVLIGGLVAMVIAGIKFAADANSDQVWIFLSEVFEEPAPLVLAYVMLETLNNRRVAGGS